MRPQTTKTDIITIRRENRTLKEKNYNPLCDYAVRRQKVW